MTCLAKVCVYVDEKLTETRRKKRSEPQRDRLDNQENLSENKHRKSYLGYVLAETSL